MHPFLRRLLTAVLALTALSAASAQKPTPQPAAVPGPWANKFFMPGIDKNPAQPAPRVLVHDFGAVPFGTVCTQKFTITNPYDVPMQVLDVRVECGCLRAYPPSKVMQPNETAEFAVTMDAGKFRGPNAKKMFVAFGPNFVSTAELQFQATSREDVTLTPGVAEFGIVPQGKKVAPVTVGLKYEGRMKDWKVTGVVATDAPIEVEVKEASRGGLFAVSYYVTVTLKENAPAGLLTVPVVLKTNDPATPLLTVNVSANVQPAVSVNPDKVTFRAAAVGQVSQYKVLIKGNGQVPFTVSPIGPEADGVRLEGILPAKNVMHLVTVKYEPKQAGAFRHEVKLATSLGGPPMVLVIEGEAK